MHAAEVRQKNNFNKNDKGISTLMKAKLDEKAKAAHERLLYRAKMYAMNCLMKSFREAQIKKFYEERNRKTSSVIDQKNVDEDERGGKEEGKKERKENILIDGWVGE